MQNEFSESMICSNCQTDNPSAARFCMNCGANLNAATKQTTGFQLERLIPRELLAKLEAARAQGGLAGERRVITILFCDVKGSTAAAEQLDPEEWAQIINGAFEVMIAPIYKYEGIVPRLMGDAILAFFGAPIAHEDDPQRAVLAALEIRSGAEAYCSRMREEYGIDIQVRIGINTGLVVVGEIGSDLRMEYTAMGDAINLAARMEQTAEPGTIQISNDTFKLVAPFFEVMPLGELQVKGKAGAVTTYRVLASKGAPGQLRGLDGLSSPLVGRAAELALLGEQLRSLAAGRGSFVAVIGEAGLGKTTLLGHARSESGEAQQLNWLEGHALSYAQSVSYLVWRQIVRQSIGAQENDAPSDVRDKLNYACSCCEIPGGDRAFLEAMLAVESETSLKEVSGFQGEALVQRMTEAVRGYLCGLAREQPLVVLLDDLHWMDAASLTLLSNVLDLVEQNPILFIGLSRPEPDGGGIRLIEQARARLNGGFHEILLAPLPPEATNELLVNLLGLRELPQQVFQLVLEKAEGNPFFVEELIRSLIETKQIIRREGGWEVPAAIRELSLPGTLTGLLGARIDRLPEPARRVLQVASVIGRSFDVRVLAPMLDNIADLEPRISSLRHAGLLQPADAGTQFVFRHVLVQEAAYGSILLKQRRQLHTRAGDLLLELYPERVEELAPLVANHFHAAQDARALAYDLLAGQSAERLYANAEAAFHYGRALETATRLGVEHNRVSDIYSKWGHALEQCGRYEEAVAAYESMRAYAREHNSPSIEMTALVAIATVFSTFTSLHNPAKAEQMITQAIELARQIGDRATQTRLHWNLMISYLFSNRLQAALLHGEQALELARGLEDREQLAFVLNDLCRLYTCLGKFERAYAVISEARGLWQELGNQAMLTDSFGSEAEARLAAGDHPRALTLLQHGLELSEQTENLWGQAYNRMLISFAKEQLGEIGAAIALSLEAVVAGDRAGLLASSIAHRADLAWMYANYGAPEKSWPLLDVAVRSAEEKQPGWKNLPLAVQVRVHLMQGELSAAEKLAGPLPLEPITIPYPRYTIIVLSANVELVLARGETQRALELADELLARVTPLTRMDLPDVMRLKARVLTALERIEEAQDVLAAARAEAEAMSLKHQLWPILMDLSEINSKRGKNEQADADRAAAAQIIDAIAATLAPHGMSESFLKRKP